MIIIKRTLRFNENGKFKILMISDIQETLNYDHRTIKGMDAMLDAEKPDLVIWGGDNCDGRKVKLKEELEEYLKIFMESPFYWKQLKDFSSGTGQPNVNGNSLKNLLLPLPPLEEQKRIVDFYFDFLPTIATLTDFSL